MTSAFHMVGARPRGSDGITLGTAVGLTGVAQVTFDIPEGTKIISVNMGNVSFTGNTNLSLQIGPAAGIETTGYLGGAGKITGSSANNNSTSNMVLGFNMSSGTVAHGRAVLELIDEATNLWACTAHLGGSASAEHYLSGWTKALAGPLTQLRLSSPPGTDLFDGGSANVQFYKAPKIADIVAVTMAASGTLIDVTGVPADAKHISINVSGLSTTGTAVIAVQIGDSGGLETTGYLGSGGFFQTTGANANFSAGFLTDGNTGSANTYFGQIFLELLNPATNIWTMVSRFGRDDSDASAYGAGVKTLSAPLDRFRLTMNGSTSFDAGAIGVQYWS